MSNAWINATRDARDAGYLSRTTYRGAMLDETTEQGVDITLPMDVDAFPFRWAHDQREARRAVDDVYAEQVRDHYDRG